jgi:two-component system NtrC family sensor kinase
VVAPLTAKEERLGVLVIRCRRPAGDIDASEIDLIETLARQAEIAFDNAILYQNLLATHQKLKSSQAQLVQSGKMAAVGQLAAGVAHEVNNPLQIILSRVQLLMMRHRELEPLVKDLHLIESNVKRISRIIRSLLDFARHNTGDEEWRRIDLVYLITQTVNLMQHLMEKAGIEVEVSHPSGGPPTIHGNVGEVEQIFLNLLINARQAMPDGGRIDITIRVEEETAIVRVSDTGEGIPEGYLERIFDPFFTTREEEGGTGLGLSIIYGIIEKHNGRIEVESNEGLGTSFELQLPIEPS